MTELILNTGLSVESEFFLSNFFDILEACKCL